MTEAMQNYIFFSASPYQNSNPRPRPVSGKMGSPGQFRSISSGPNRNYFSSNTLLIPEMSEYHEKCIPKETRERVQSAPPKNRKGREYQLCNHVAEEKIWEERCRKERTLQKNW